MMEWSMNFHEHTAFDVEIVKSEYSQTSLYVLPRGSCAACPIPTRPLSLSVHDDMTHSLLIITSS